MEKLLGEESQYYLRITNGKMKGSLNNTEKANLV